MKRFFMLLLLMALTYNCSACTVTQKSNMSASSKAVDDNDNADTMTEDAKPENITGDIDLESLTEDSKIENVTKDIESENATDDIKSGNITDDFKSGNITEDTESEKINEAEIAQRAYDMIDIAESLCKDGMEIITFAWHFGIWEAYKCGTDTVMEKLAAQIGFDVSFIEENGGYTADELINGDGNFGGWEFCLMTAENCLAASGTFTSVNDALDIARELIRKLPDDYEYYADLKDYYTKVAAYAAYFEHVTGSYNDMTDAVSEYENNIQKVKEALLFEFG